MVWNLFPFKVILVLGKARSCRAPNLVCRGAESPRWFDVSQKNYRGDGLVVVGIISQISIVQDLHFTGVEMHSISSLCHEDTLPWDETLTWKRTELLAEFFCLSCFLTKTLLDYSLVSFLWVLFSARPQLWPTMSMSVHSEFSFSKNPVKSAPILS